MPKKPLRYPNREALVRALKKHGCDLKKAYTLGAGEITESPEEVTGWISGNTYRAFHHCKRPPSEIAREWGARSMTDKKLMGGLADVRTAADYDEWHRKWCDGLRRHWLREAGKQMSFGASRKLPDILMKGMLSDYRSEVFTNPSAVRVAGWAHVPLDEYSLSCVRHEFKKTTRTGREGYLIPCSAKMGWVPDYETYMKIQNGMREVAKEAGVHPLALDDLAWDSRH